LTLFPRAGFDPIPPPAAASDGSLHFRIAASSCCFDGHFDGAPILPGVAHVALALSACVTQGGKARVLTGVRDVRLKRPLRPGDEVEVLLTESPDGASVKFEIRSLGESVTIGHLLFDCATGLNRG
jgi:3-hydroxymyristoyl/3-hydroxydecanoyl-(acyl carrier protein) dehydratase